MTHKCRKCSEELVIGINITQYKIDNYQYICRNCERAYHREWLQERPGYHSKYACEWSHRTGRNAPMSENKKCSSFLGVYVAERVLSHVFKNVVRMPYGNPGFDFTCGSGYDVDVKSSCRHYHEGLADSWMFGIQKNQIAQYFLLLAFDNRELLNPEHIWLIPAGEINHLVTASIAETTLGKWNEHALSINEVFTCCNTLKMGNNNG